MEQELPLAELLRRIQYALDTMDALPRAVSIGTAIAIWITAGSRSNWASVSLR